MAHSMKLLARTYQKAGTALRRKYSQEYKQIKAEGLNEAQAQAKLQRIYRQEFRVLVNEVAKLNGYSTHEMRRERAIANAEKRLAQLKGEI